MAILGVKPIAFSCCICQNQTKVAIGFLLPFDAIYPVFFSTRAIGYRKFL